MTTDEILYVFSCGGHGTRFRQTSSADLPKVLFPLDEYRGITTLEYHLRMLVPPAQIGLAAGQYKGILIEYLEKHDGFGHDWRNFYWIPQRYRTPEAVIESTQVEVPNFPYGAGSWLVFEENYIKELQKRRISIIMQTAGNKVGERPDLVRKMIQRLQEGLSEWIVAIYSDVDRHMVERENWYGRFDIIADGKVFPRRQDTPSRGNAICYWYAFRIDSVSRLWKPDVRKSIEAKAAQYPQRRHWHSSNGTIELKIAEISIPLLLKYFQFETFEVSRNQGDLGISLKTRADIAECKDIFEKRESEGFLRAR